MAHERKRHLDKIFKQLLGFSPIVGVFGHRQVGKSTFLASATSNYRTLDDLDTLDFAHKDPKKFVAGNSPNPMVIDECQMEPKLFPTLKEFVRTRKSPGQFVLSGSVRFTSRLAIKESLAGRMAMLEMLPFSVSEIIGEDLSDCLVKIFNHKHFSNDSVRQLRTDKECSSMQKHLMSYLENGGLPGLCFVRNKQLQKSALSELHDLMLSRDMLTASNVRTPAASLKRFLSHISRGGLEPYVAAEATRVFGLAAQTQKTIIAAFESMFLIRRIPVMGGKRECFLLEDQLEEHTYAGESISLLQRFETALYRNIRTQFMYRLDKVVQIETYLTRDHARVPIVVRDQDQMLGITVFEGEAPTLSDLRSGASLLKKFGQAKMLYLSTGVIPPKVLDERNLCCSAAAIL